MTQADALLDRAAQWRAAFDHAFATAPAEQATVLHDFLAVRAGTSGYALRLDEIAGLQPLRGLAPYPGAHRGLLGLATFRGDVLAVYDLGALLGHRAVTAGRAPAWWAVPRQAPVGLAFDAFERHLRLPPEALVQAGAAGAAEPGAQALRVDGLLRPIVSVQTIVQNIRALLAAPQPSRENP